VLLPQLLPLLLLLLLLLMLMVEEALPDPLLMLTPTQRTQTQLTHLRQLGGLLMLAPAV
jgi:hypothetical protein